MKRIYLLVSTCIALLLGACVQETHLKTVTMRVDMNTVENVGNVGLRGNFTSPPWQETLLLEDPDGDGVYEGTFSQQAANGQISFKFVNQNEQFELPGQDNRSLSFEYKPETIVYTAKFNDPKAEITRN